MSVATPTLEQGSGAVLEQDHYCERLANVNEDNAVIATEDIGNAHGAVLVSKGARIDRSTPDRVLKPKLFKPLEKQVAVENQLDPGRLSEYSQTLFDKSPDLRTLHDAVELGPPWHSMTEHCPLPAALSI